MVNETAYWVHTLNPVAFYVGNQPIKWYGIMGVCVATFAALYGLYLIKRYKLTFSPTFFLNSLPGAVIFVVLAGKLGDALFYYPERLFTDPVQTLKTYNSGLSFHGSFIFVTIYMILYAWVGRKKILHYCDLIVCLVPHCIGLVRIGGNFVNGELYGRVTDVPWAVIFPRGGMAPRHPSQIYEGLTEGVLLFFVMRYLFHKYHHIKGYCFFSFMWLYGVIRFLVEYFREPDPIPWWPSMNPYWLSMGQLLCLVMVAVGMFGLWVIVPRVNRVPTPPKEAT